MGVNGAESLPLISMVYTYSSAWFTNNIVEVPDLIRLENGYIFWAKSKFPYKIQAYFRIDPLYEDAMDEIIRCHTTLHLDGIKLLFKVSSIWL